MRFSFAILEALHRQSSGHRQTLESAVNCGCFYCKRTFSPAEIESWIDGGTTAMCPHCGIDSVVPETRQFELTPDLLDEMHAYWFERSVHLPLEPGLLQKARLKIEPLMRRLSWFRSKKGAG